MKNAICLMVMGAALAGAAHTVYAQGFAPYPVLRDGEVLQYKIESERLGTIGTARLQVDLDSLEDRLAYRISLDFSARIPDTVITGETRSWVDAETLSTLYLTRCVRSPAGERSELIEIATALNTWSDSTGAHPLAAADPLDELALIYLLRGLPAADLSAALVLDRHFDADRNPVRIRGLGRAAVVAMGNTYPASILELGIGQRAEPPRTVVVYLSRDAARLPLRIDLSLPGVGALIFKLQSATDVRRLALTGPE